jgi:hypothetical protein
MMISTMYSVNGYRKRTFLRVAAIFAGLLAGLGSCIAQRHLYSTVLFDGEVHPFEASLVPGYTGAYLGGVRLPGGGEVNSEFIFEDARVTVGRYRTAVQLKNLSVSIIDAAKRGKAITRKEVQLAWDLAKQLERDAPARPMDSLALPDEPVSGRLKELFEGTESETAPGTRGALTKLAAQNLDPALVPPFVAMLAMFADAKLRSTGRALVRAQHAYDAYVATADSAPDVGFNTGQFGIVRDPDSDSTLLVATLFKAFPEFSPSQDHKSFRIDYGVSGSVIPVVSPGGGGTTYRGGFNAVLGNPDSVLGSVSLSQYLTPNVLDAEALISAHLFSTCSGTDLTKLNGAAANQLSVSERHLFDHLRPGDLWFDAGFRVLSSQQAGQAAEGGFTYCLPIKMGTKQYPDLAPTITATATYCEQDNLGLNEGGFELSIPVIGIGGQPFYLTGRYGTRGDTAFSLLFRF